MLDPHEIIKLREHLSASADWGPVALEAGLASSPIDMEASSDWDTVFIEHPRPKAVPFTPPAFVLGDPIDRSCLNGIGKSSVHIPPHVVSVARNVRIVGWRALLGEAGGLHVGGLSIRNKEQLDRVAQQVLENHQGFLLMLDSSGKPHLLYRPASRNFELDGLGAYISTVEPGNYGSFLFRVLPALLMLGHLKLALDYLIVPERTNWMMRALDLVGLGHLRVFSTRETVGLVCPEIYVVSDIDNEAFLDSFTLNRMRSLAGFCVNCFPLAAPSIGRIYVSRALATLRSARNRNLVNEELIETAARHRGFKVIHPETLTFEQQVALFASASLIAGPSGSGMLNSAFASPGTRVIDLESFHFTVRQHAKLYASSQKEYGFVFGMTLDEIGRPLHNRSWHLKLEDFNAALDLFGA